MKSFLIVLCGLLAFASFARAASAPWYQAAAVLKKTIGASPCAQVGQPVAPTDGTRQWTITIQACSPKTARALAIVLKPQFYTSAAIVVAGPDGAKETAPDPDKSLSVDELKEAFVAALGENPYFAAARSTRAFAPLTVEFKPEVVQVWSDNISDFYGMTNYVAADAFKQSLRLEFGAIRVGITTSRKK
jgi:hypothetical protein